MKTAFLNYLIEKKLCTRKDRVLLAVSGGIDSMVMLNLFRECEYEIGVAHVNFQLRGRESDEDEKLVEESCARLSIPFYTKRFETSQYAEGKSLSIQMAARNLRYVWFNELIDEHHFDLIATAHHLNDSIETVLLNFSRGAGLEGYDGIAPKNKKIIRPMLFATREEIEQYAKGNCIVWHEDKSNATDDYQRNFIRHQVVPLLKELNPSLENSFHESIEKTSGATELFALGILYWKEKFETRKDEQIHLAKKGIYESTNEAGLLWNLIKEYGFNIDQCLQVVKSTRGQPGKKFLSLNYELVIDREHLIISKHVYEVGDVIIEKGQLQAMRGKYTLDIGAAKSMEINKDHSLALLDVDKLQFPLLWRKWKQGDSFFPLGMNHKKKLSDFFVDERISIADKEMITVLESASEIVWVVGHRIDDRFKITESTTRVIRFALHR